MIEVAALERWLGITSSSTTNLVLRELEQRAVAYLEEQTGRYFGPIESPVYTEIVLGLGARDLWLSELPAACPDSVTECEYPGASVATITAQAADGFVLRTSGHEARLVRKGDEVWEDGWEYTIAYERGYAVEEEPGDIKQAIYDLVRLAYGAREASGEGGIVSETFGNYSYRLSEAAVSSDPEVRAAAWSVQATITRWRRPVIA